MAIQRVTPKNINYGEIDRGTSLTIPVRIINPEDNPVDLSGTRVAFTVKRNKYDFDMDDSRAYIKKDFEPQDPSNGRFWVQLSSKDTNFEPATGYCFDIQIYRDDGIAFRVANLEFTLSGGPTNRTISDGIGDLPIGPEISVIVLGQGRPITVVTPFAVDSSINTQLGQIWSMLADIQNDISAMQEDIESLREAADSANTDILDIQPRLIEVEAEIADLEGRVIVLEG